MSETTVVEGEAVEVGTEVVPASPGTLFRTDDPAEVLTRAQQTAAALMPVVRERRLAVKIQNKEYLTVEAWQTLGAMLGVTPVCEWTRPVERGWEARVLARTLDGRTIGAAEAECLRDESRWRTADDYAVRSMAQTRATSKALSSVLRFVATLAGVEGTPAEEMPQGGAQRGSRATASARASAPRAVTAKQKGKINALLGEAGLSKDEAAAIRVWWTARAGESAFDRLPSKAASELIDALDSEGADRLLAELRSSDDERDRKIAERYLGAE